MRFRLQLKIILLIIILCAIAMAITLVTTAITLAVLTNGYTTPVPEEIPLVMVALNVKALITVGNTIICLILCIIELKIAGSFFSIYDDKSGRRMRAFLCLDDYIFERNSSKRYIKSYEFILPSLSFIFIGLICYILTIIHSAKFVSGYMLLLYSPLISMYATFVMFGFALSVPEKNTVCPNCHTVYTLIDKGLTNITKKDYEETKHETYEENVGTVYDSHNNKVGNISRNRTDTYTRDVHKETWTANYHCMCCDKDCEFEDSHEEYGDWK